MQKTNNQRLIFSKYHGAGNDFVMINAIKAQVNLSDDDV